MITIECFLILVLDEVTSAPMGQSKIDQHILILIPTDISTEY